jgi:hypothetical protein
LREEIDSMPGYSDPGFDTLALHAGAAPDPATGARAVPIHLTTSFVFESSDHAAALFNLERAGHVYSRISNPTNAVLEQRVAALEGGIGAISTASGQAALHLAVATLMGAGGHIVASTALYGGSQNLLHYTLRRFGIDTTFVQPGDIDGWRAAVRPNTRLLLRRNRGQPRPGRAGHRPPWPRSPHAAGVPLLVDSTLTTPWHQKPLAHGGGHGLPLGHQVPERARHGDRRRGGGRRQLRLGCRACTQWPVCRAGRALRRLSTTWSSLKKAPWAPFCCVPAARGCATSGPA